MLQEGAAIFLLKEKFLVVLIYARGGAWLRLKSCQRSAYVLYKADSGTDGSFLCV
jgi:hypothetical protein